ncbi:hydantoinase/oxoprolinase family protein [Sediminicoccus sp. KRV36]|uniref:hydantoinase/oxoprolinase family protein n=1 Tax=Sediminicoccus sp. KRV36 TaxID=3133721 RepID=UPI00201085CD|nr:hydantoinase/oxoprolinase family protein [Sediminicoccus rosea]UPY36733.1 hydantoinase/oxoprolinase family protein [Sediminicoccus rosea]
MLSVGVEIGGTFTDLVAIGPDGVQVAKVPSTPARPDEAAFHALAAAGIAAATVGEFVHGSTVATNAVLERRGARLALLVTEGFRDVLILGRQDKLRLFDLRYRKPVPLVAREDSIEMPERVLADGSVILPLDLAAAEARIGALLAGASIGAVAICLLNAYANPAHEQALAALVRRLAPGLPVTCSHEVTQEFREYERASTTALSAYVQPVLDAYLGRMERHLAEQGFTGDFSVMQSNGGRVPAVAMRRNAVTALLSGPAAGVMGAARQAGLSGVQDIITLDIGGTSADVALIEAGRPGLAREAMVDGLVVQMPMLDITTVGAGGGSLAWVDEGGLLRVGPRSAGADPGPAAYGRGGTRPTLTDAQVIAGRIPAGKQLAGGLIMDGAAARAAFAPLAATLGLSIEATAESVVRIAVANVVAAVRLVSTERGRDPRQHVLVPYGGAGPLHAAAVAEELGMTRVLVPPGAGVLSAYGLLAADHSLFAARTRRRVVASGCAEAVRAEMAALRAELDARFDSYGVQGERRFEITLDMRLVGQAFEIAVSLEPSALDSLDEALLLAGFSAAHERIYRAPADTGRRAVEIISYRAGLHVTRAGLPGLGGARRLHAPCAGPLLIEDSTASIWVPPGWTAEEDSTGNLMMTRDA